MNRRLFSIALLFVPVFTSAAHAQPAGQACSPPPITVNARSQNIFTPEQEMDLGDAIYERVQKDYRVLEGAEVNSYLQKIGDRLARHLPSTNIHYRYSVADLPDTNAFALVGGRILITRKLISFVRSEDELAGVVAHELGHAVVRHGGIDMSRYFKEVLGIDGVGDRRDVFNKYNQLLENWRTKRVKFSNSHEDAQQLEADKIGMYALMAAGYDPHAFTAFWTRFTDAKKTNFFTELFGRSRPADKRLSEMIEAVKTLPQTCFEKKEQAAPDFDRWRLHVINFAGMESKESLVGLVTRSKLVPLRTDIDHLRFSPNGEFVVAQDSSTVYVVRRSPFALLFQFEAEEAMPASFTPDSKHIIVHNKNLRVQKWSVENKSLASVYEVAVPRGIWQSQISPDGRTLAAFQYDGDLVLYDVESNEELFKEKDFYLPNPLEVFIWQFTLDLLGLNELTVVNMVFSPDGKYFMAGRKGMRFFGSQNRETIAVELSTRKPFSIGSNVKSLLFNSFTFLGPDRIAGTTGSDIEKSGIFSFPDGKRLEQFELSGNQFQKAVGSELLIVRPVSGAAVGVYDLKLKKYTIGNKKSAFDLFENEYVAERKNGELALYQLGATSPMASVELPQSTFGTLRAASLSVDGKMLAVSDRSRGAVWDLSTGERKFHVRGFRGSYFGDSSKIYADFPKQGDVERTVALMDLTSGQVQPLNPVSASNTRQHGAYLITRRSKDERRDQDSKKDLPRAFIEEEREKAVTFKNSVFEVSDVRTGARLWARDFENETPRYSITANHETITFVWPLQTQAAKDILRSNPQLAERARLMQDKKGDYLFQFVDSATGVNRGAFLLETGEGSFEVEGVTLYGDYVVVDDDENRILVHSLKTGQLKQRFFGDHFAISESNGLIGVQNVAGRIIVYDLNNGAERSTLVFTKPISMLRFLPDGKRLFVLTADQTAFFFDTGKL